MNEDNRYFRILYICLAVAMAFVIFFMTGCKVIRKASSSRKDSVVTNQTAERTFKFDSSGSKSDKTYTKETYIPVSSRDTNNFTFNLPESKPQYIYIKETGTEKLEQADKHVDTSWKDAFNQLSLLVANSQSSKQKEAFPMWGLWVIVGAIILLLLKNFLPFKIIKV